jgi:hypothetical protein
MSLWSRVIVEPAKKLPFVFTSFALGVFGTVLFVAKAPALTGKPDEGHIPDVKIPTVYLATQRTSGELTYVPWIHRKETAKINAAKAAVAHRIADDKARVAEARQLDIEISGVTEAQVHRDAAAHFIKQRISGLIKD